MENNAFFLQPFIAYEERIENWFFNAFTSVDVPLNGNQFRYDTIGQSLLGRINDQTLGTLSFGAGKWLFFDTSRPLEIGLAISSEVKLRDHTSRLRFSRGFDSLFNDDC